MQLLAYVLTAAMTALAFFGPILWLGKRRRRPMPARRLSGARSGMEARPRVSLSRRAGCVCGRLLTQRLLRAGGAGSWRVEETPTAWCHARR